MKNTITTASKEAQKLLKTEGFISENDLQGIDLTQVADDLLEKLLGKLNPAEKTSTGKQREFLSIYKEQNDFLKAEGRTSLQGHAKKGYFQKKRGNLRSQMHSLIAAKATKAKFMAFLKEHYTAPDLEKPETFLGGSKSQSTRLEVLAYLAKLK
tara:strand:- start:2262 stop:2723 length:462 start_codon:yes stop_codon:yes gene_type:complete